VWRDTRCRRRGGGRACRASRRLLFPRPAKRGEGGARSAPGEGSVVIQSELRKQVFQDNVASLQDVIVPVPDDLKSIAGQNGIASFIPIGIQMLTAVDLNEESTFETTEVQYIILKGDLAAKFYLRKTPIAKQMPHRRFGKGRGATHVAGVGTIAFCSRPMVCTDRHDPSPGSLRSPPSPTRGEGKRLAAPTSP
jgi:hypothetical protein